MIHTRDLRAGYGDRQVLHGVTASFRRRKTTAILGPGGSGKSTLMRLLAVPRQVGLWQTGSVHLAGSVVSMLNQHQRQPKAANAAMEEDRARQRLDAVRAALVGPGDLLLLDEPDVGLDHAGKHELDEGLQRVRHQRTLVIVTHHLGLAQRVADYVLLLIDGLVVESGEAVLFFNKPSRQRTRDFLKTGC